jgi:CubicO group peptidase (beta-lactamase class C family)
MRCRPAPGSAPFFGSAGNAWRTEIALAAVGGDAARAKGCALARAVRRHSPRQPAFDVGADTADSIYKVYRRVAVRDRSSPIGIYIVRLGARAGRGTLIPVTPWATAIQKEACDAPSQTTMDPCRPWRRDGPCPLRRGHVADAEVSGRNMGRAALSQSGWSAQRLDSARTFSRQVGSAAVVVVQHGAIVAAWGDTGTNFLLNSARKSLLSAAMGIAVSQGQVHLDDTLAQLGIDDVPPALTAAEKQATVRDLLEARSGVYHPANYETASMGELRPARGSHPPGTFWYYNNWDFNALGTIYEHATGMSIFAGFARNIATPIGM